MSFPFIFANLPAGATPASDLDQNFTSCGNMGIISCTETGTNALSLTPRANFYAPTAYNGNQAVAFTAQNTSTGAVTAAIVGLSFLKVFTPSGIQAVAGDIVINSNYIMAFFPNLDAGAGGWLILNSQLPSVAQPTIGSFANLVLSNLPPTVSNSQLLPTADELVLENSSGGTVRLRGFAPGITNINTTGAVNGLDVGAPAASTMYYWWAIFNPTTLVSGGLFSLSSSAPTLPSGFTYKARFGAIPTNATANFNGFVQKGRIAQYNVNTTLAVGSGTPFPPIIDSGAKGTYSLTNPTLLAVTVAANSGASMFVPLTASRIHIVVANNWKGSAASSILVAPNVNWGGTNNGPQGSNGVIWPVALPSTAIDTNVWLTLESTQIAWASNAAGAALGCLGWEDNI